ncbi:hypothetical protein [Oceanithermus sp.]|uniref:hypothetical protein n=1 Tax=Oceanithermus sp. TaxID=2268145 RepID=UPI0025DA78A7|nr:hypothetical protein [Oceanithermus sp.]
MKDVHFRLVTGTDPELFEERLNHAVSELPEDAIIVDILFSTAHSGRVAEYSALIYYKEVEPWKD